MESRLTERIIGKSHLENLTSSHPALAIRALHMSFGNVEVLRGVSFTARTGDVISMLGASGSGKSTLLRCINLLEIPNSGSIMVHGETIQMTTDRRGNRKGSQKTNI